MLDKTKLQNINNLFRYYLYNTVGVNVYAGSPLRKNCLNFRKFTGVFQIQNFQSKYYNFFFCLKSVKFANTKRFRIRKKLPLNRLAAAEKRLHIYWVPGHKIISGNEKGAEIAKNVWLPNLYRKFHKELTNG